jgi:hypothetical protein
MTSPARRNHAGRSQSLLAQATMMPAIVSHDLRLVVGSGTIEASHSPRAFVSTRTSMKLSVPWGTERVREDVDPVSPDDEAPPRKRERDSRGGDERKRPQSTRRLAYEDAEAQRKKHQIGGMRQCRQAEEGDREQEVAALTAGEEVLEEEQREQHGEEGDATANAGSLVVVADHDWRAGVEESGEPGCDWMTRQGQCEQKRHHR